MAGQSFLLGPQSNISQPARAYLIWILDASDFEAAPREEKTGMPFCLQ